jgi:hypothetical protein
VLVLQLQQQTVHQRQPLAEAVLAEAHEGLELLLHLQEMVAMDILVVAVVEAAQCTLPAHRVLLEQVELAVLA